MKYEEVIEKIKEFKLDYKYGKIENLNSLDWMEIEDKKVPYMENLFDQLLNAEDLDIHHNEYFEINELKIEKLNQSDLEDLLLKKQNYLEDLIYASKGDQSLIYMPISDTKIKEVQYKVSKIILLIEKKLSEKEQKRKPEKGLTLTKKIALLKSIGFYDKIKELNGSNAYKAKITQLLTGGSLDTITKNIKNLDLDIKDIDAKYTSYQHVEDMKSLVSQIKSTTRGK